MNLQNGSSSSKRSAPFESEVPAKAVKLGQPGSVITNYFSVREPIAKQPNIDYAQTCPLCDEEFRNCMKNKMKLSNKDYFAQHLRKCMFAPEDKLKQFIDGLTPQKSKQLSKSLLKRREKYKNLANICKIEIDGSARVLEMFFGKNKAVTNEAFSEKKISIAWNTATQDDVDRLFSVNHSRSVDKEN